MEKYLTVLNWEMILAAAGLITALCALGATFWQMYETRRHNMLTVRPILIPSFVLDPTEKKLTVNLVNQGLGPALIKSFEISNRMVNISNPVMNSDFQMLIQDTIANLNSDIKYFLGTRLIHEGASKREGWSDFIYYVQFDSKVDSRAVMNLGNSILNHVNFEVVYSSVYHDKNWKISFHKHFKRGQHEGQINPLIEEAQF